MNKEHMMKLKDISDCCNIELTSLVDTYSNKQTDYISRDLKNHKPVSAFDVQGVYGLRAIAVMTKYVVKNYDYCESWIE